MLFLDYLMQLWSLSYSHPLELIRSIFENWILKLFGRTSTRLVLQCKWHMFPNEKERAAKWHGAITVMKKNKTRSWSIDLLKRKLITQNKQILQMHFNLAKCKKINLATLLSISLGNSMRSYRAIRLQTLPCLPESDPQCFLWVIKWYNNQPHMKLRIIQRKERHIWYLKHIQGMDLELFPAWIISVYNICITVNC